MIEKSYVETLQEMGIDTNTQQIDLNNLQSKHGKHHYLRQEGPYIYCLQCGEENKCYVGPDKMLVQTAHNQYDIVKY